MIKPKQEHHYYHHYRQNHHHHHHYPHHHHHHHHHPCYHYHHHHHHHHHNIILVIIMIIIIIIIILITIIIIIIVIIITIIIIIIFIIINIIISSSSSLSSSTHEHIIIIKATTFSSCIQTHSGSSLCHGGDGFHNKNSLRLYKTITIITIQGRIRCKVLACSSQLSFAYLPFCFRFAGTVASMAMSVALLISLSGPITVSSLTPNVSKIMFSFLLIVSST